VSQVQPQWFCAAGVQYRHATEYTTPHACESRLAFTWHYRPTGEEGTSFVVLNTSNEAVARRHLFALLSKWNDACPALWSYREGSDAKVHTTH
jgi:hypothetical protein